MWNTRSKFNVLSEGALRTQTLVHVSLNSGRLLARRTSTRQAFLTSK